MAVHPLEHRPARVEQLRAPARVRRLDGPAEVEREEEEEARRREGDGQRDGQVELRGGRQCRSGRAARRGVCKEEVVEGEPGGEEGEVEGGDVVVEERDALDGREGEPPQRVAAQQQPAVPHRGRRASRRAKPPPRAAGAEAAEEEEEERGEAGEADAPHDRVRRHVDAAVVVGVALCRGPVEDGLGAKRPVGPPRAEGMLLLDAGVGGEHPRVERADRGGERERKLPPARRAARGDAVGLRSGGAKHGARVGVAAWRQPVRVKPRTRDGRGKVTAARGPRRGASPSRQRKGFGWKLSPRPAKGSSFRCSAMLPR